MKSITKLFIAFSLLILLLFVWNEWQDWSPTKKINADKVSAFFTAIGSVLTAVTVYLLYNQIKEQIEDRKAASKPDLYPAEAFFTVKEFVLDGHPGIKYPIFVSEDFSKSDEHETSLPLHNIGLGAAKEIKLQWYFNEQECRKSIEGIYHNPNLSTLYSSEYDFILADNRILISIPDLFLYSFGKDAMWANETTMRLLALEVNYKDTSEHLYKKFFLGGGSLDDDSLYIFFRSHPEIPGYLKNPT